MDSNAIAQATELASKLTLSKPNLNILKPEFREAYPSDLAHILEEHFQASDAQGRLLLPDLSAFDNKNIGIFSDYSGEGSGNYHTYSFLVCALNLTDHFEREMRSVREQYRLGEKELSFKDLRMGQIQAALPQYLELLDKFVPGLLYTLVIDKRITTLFGPFEKATKSYLAEILHENGLGKRKPDDAEKLLRIVHTAAYLTGLLSHDGQGVFWMTDHDNICANEGLLKGVLELFQRVLNLYSANSHPKIGGAAPFAKRDLRTLDLLSAADLVAGSLEHYLTRREVAAQRNFEVKAGAERVLQWLGHNGIGLRKMNVLMRPTDDGKIHNVELVLTPQNPPQDVVTVQVAM